MKKYYIGYVVAMLLLSTRLLAQTPPDRNVFWLHGFGENGSTWATYAQLFQGERKLISTSRTYGGSQGVSVAVKDANWRHRKALPSNSAGIADTNNIVIGHSLGGIVGREMARTYNSTDTMHNIFIGGIITVGSPNNGLPLVNRMKNGDVDAAMDHACIQMSKGPKSGIVTALTGPGLVGLFLNVTVGNISWTNEDMCAALRKRVLDSMYTPGTSSMQNYANTAATPTDLAVGSIALQQINNSSTTVPRIAIWGSEASPVHWRTVSSSVTSNVSDKIVPQIANKFRGIYNGFYVTQNILGIVHAISTAINASF